MAGVKMPAHSLEGRPLETLIRQQRDLAKAALRD